MSEPPADQPRVLPALVRYPLLVLLGGGVLVGLVVALYDRGVLPIAGPFVAVVLAGVIVYLVLWARRRRLRRLAARARMLVERLRGELDAGVRAELWLDEVDVQLQQLAQGREQEAVESLRRVAVAAAGWPDGPSRRTALELGEVGDSIARNVERMRRVARQGGRRG